MHLKQYLVACNDQNRQQCLCQIEAYGASTFTISNRDFHVLSFRSNVVMRWEWVPGSTLFVVWQQNRRTSDAYRQVAMASELWRSTRAAGDNLLSVKVSYWLPVFMGGQKFRAPAVVPGEN